jgi:aspartyl/asparaginyl-tRNA synthetase
MRRGEELHRPEVWDALKPLGQESSLIITGKVREDSRAPGGFEIDVTNAEVLQNAHDFPITPKEHGPEFLLDNRHLWLRSKKQHAILKVRHAVVKAVRDFLDNDGFTLLDTPIFTPAACEGTSTLLKLITSATRKPISPNQVSFTTRQRRPPSARFTASVRRFALRSQRRAGT